MSADVKKAFSIYQKDGHLFCLSITLQAAGLGTESQTVPTVCNRVLLVRHSQDCVSIHLQEPKFKDLLTEVGRHYVQAAVSLYLTGLHR